MNHEYLEDARREYLFKLGYGRMVLVGYQNIESEPYDYIVFSSLKSNKMHVGSWSRNYRTYDGILNMIDTSNIESYLNMSDEEFELLVRLN